MEFKQFCVDFTKFTGKTFIVFTSVVFRLYNVLILAVEIWGHVLDNAIYGVSVKLFLSVQILIFLACNAFHHWFYAFWREGLGRKYFFFSADTGFHEGILLFIVPNMDL